eukprot:scaffold112854_cov63-Phaeocystis_antarctica.AAC.1
MGGGGGGGGRGEGGAANQGRQGEGTRAAAGRQGLGRRPAADHGLGARRLLPHLVSLPVFVHAEGEAALAVEADTHEPVDCEHGADGAAVLVVRTQAARDTGALETQLGEGRLQVLVVVGEGVLRVTEAGRDLHGDGVVELVVLQHDLQRLCRLAHHLGRDVHALGGHDEELSLVALGGDAVVVVVDLPIVQRVGERVALRGELAHLVLQLLPLLGPRAPAAEDRHRRQCHVQQRDAHDILSDAVGLPTAPQEKLPDGVPGEDGMHEDAADSGRRERPQEALDVAHPRHAHREHLKGDVAHDDGRAVNGGVVEHADHGERGDAAEEEEDEHQGGQRRGEHRLAPLPPRPLLLERVLRRVARRSVGELAQGRSSLVNGLGLGQRQNLTPVHRRDLRAARHLSRVCDQRNGPVVQTQTALDCYKPIQLDSRLSVVVPLWGGSTGCRRRYWRCRLWAP